MMQIDFDELRRYKQRDAEERDALAEQLRFMRKHLPLHDRHELARRVLAAKRMIWAWYEEYRKTAPLTSTRH